MKFEMREQEKWIILGVIVCTLIACIGYSFAYFTSGGVSGDKLEGASVNTKTADLLDIKYDGGESVTLENAYPGMSVTKKFSVTVTPTEDMDTATYYVKLEISENGFVVCDDSNSPTYNDRENNCTKNFKELTYSLKRTDSKENSIFLVQDADLTNGVMTVDPIEVTHEAKEGKAEKYDYELTIKFVESGADQNHNSGKTFKANVDVSLVK